MTETSALEYEAPRLTTLASIEALTLGGPTGAGTDAAFPIGTKPGDVTFS